MKKETKKEKFKRLAEARTNKIIKMLDLLGNCSNRTTYEYSEEDVNKIFERLYRELGDTKERFEQSKRSEKNFKL